MLTATPEYGPSSGIESIPRFLKSSILVFIEDFPLPFRASIFFVFESYTRAKTSPPTPVDIGSTTFKTDTAQTAASTAFPPFFNMSSPAFAANGLLVATVPLRPRVADLLEAYL